MTDNSICSLEAAYLQHQFVKSSNQALFTPKAFAALLLRVVKQIKIEKRHATDVRLPRHKRSIRHSREMELIDHYQRLVERMSMSIEDNREVVQTYLMDTNWLTGSIMQYMQQTEMKLASNKTKVLLRVDKLTAVYVDELLERFETPSDELGNLIAWKVHAATTALIGRGEPPDPDLMTVHAGESIFSMLNKLQLIEVFFAKGTSGSFFKPATVPPALQSILTTLLTLHSGKIHVMEMLSLFRHALKALRSLLGCYCPDERRCPPLIRQAFSDDRLVAELVYWVQVILDVRHGKTFTEARREHRQAHHGGGGDDCSSVATGWTQGEGSQTNDSFHRVVSMLGSALVNDLLVCVHAVVVASVHELVEETAVPPAPATATPAAEKGAGQSDRKPPARASSKPFTGVPDREGDVEGGSSSIPSKSKSVESARLAAASKKGVGVGVGVGSSGGSGSSGSSSGEPVAPTGPPRRTTLAAEVFVLLAAALKLSKMSIAKYAFMQCVNGNPALGCFPLLKSMDELTVASVDLASVSFSITVITRTAVDVLEAGLSLMNSRSLTCSIHNAVLLCASKAAMCLVNGGVAEDESTAKPFQHRKGYFSPDANTCRGKLVTMLSKSIPLVMHVMYSHTMSLSIQHTGLLLLRLLAREMFLSRDEIDGLVGQEEDDYYEDPMLASLDHGELDQASLSPSMDSAPSTASGNRRGASRGSAYGGGGGGGGGGRSRPSTTDAGDNESVGDRSMVSTASRVSFSSASTLVDEPSPDIDDPSVPISKIVHTWLTSTTEECFRDPNVKATSGASHGHGHAAGMMNGVLGPPVGIAALLSAIGEAHTQSPEVMEQLLLLVYQTGKSSYSIKIALLEAEFDRLIQQVNVTASGNFYLSALCDLALESLQMDQIVL